MNWTDSLDWILRTSLGMFAVGLLVVCLRKKLSSSQRFAVWGGLFAFVACTFPFRGEFPQWTLSIARWMPDSCSGAFESLTPLVEEPVQEWLGQTGQFSTVLLVWGIVSTLLLGRLLLSLTILSLHGAREHDNKRARELLMSLQNELGIQRPVRLVIHEGSPMTWGILRHCVSLPESCHDWSDQRLEWALRHEMAHIQRSDALWLLLSQIALALLWFHPVMWLVAGWMRREREMAADELVIQSGAGEADYAEVILSFSRSQRERQTALAMCRIVSSGKGRVLEARIRNVLGSGRRFSGIGGPLQILMVIVVISLMTVSLSFAVSTDLEKKCRRGSSSCVR